MSGNLPNDNQLLELRMIEYRLGLMTRSDREDFAREIERDAELRNRYETLTGALKRLDDYEAPVPQDLRGRIISAVGTNRLITQQQPLAQPDRAGSRRLAIPLMVRDFVATAAAIILIVSAWAVTANHARNERLKALCSSQLGGTGAGLSAYQIDYPGQLPQVKLGDKDAWYNFDARKPRRRQLFLLVKLKYVDPGSLACPAGKATVFLPPPDLADLADFPDAMNVTYSLQNLYGDLRFTEEQRRRRWANPGQTAIMADQTPLLRNDALQPVLQPQSQSPNHRGLSIKGQNILFLDGSVHWKDAPQVGPNQDNIWQAGKLSQYTGSEVTTDPDDIFLAP